MDISIDDEKTMLVELKSYVRPSEAIIFKKNTQLHKEVERKEPSKLIMVTPYAEDKVIVFS